MKKIILSILSIIALVGCGNCDSKPPKRAIMHTSGGMGMQYHFTIYMPTGEMGHNLSLKCTKYTYSRLEIYTDKLGNLRGDDVLWNNIYGEVNFSDYGENPHNIQLTLTTKHVVIRNWTSTKNGTYKVEDTNPDSWGVPIY